MNYEKISRNNEWQCLLLDICYLKSRIANFKIKGGGNLLRFPYPNCNLKKLCLSPDYLKSKGFGI
jgi:hypothetical protein